MPVDRIPHVDVTLLILSPELYNQSMPPVRPPTRRSVASQEDLCYSSARHPPFLNKVSHSQPRTVPSAYALLRWLLIRLLKMCDGPSGFPPTSFQPAAAPASAQQLRDELLRAR